MQSAARMYTENNNTKIINFSFKITTIFNTSHGQGMSIFMYIYCNDFCNTPLFQYTSSKI
jgi:hypothetical protein